MANESRQATRKVIDMADEGVLTWEQVARDCMNYMSEDQVADMAWDNGYFEHDEEEDDE
jgi:hypothetical protein